MITRQFTLYLENKPGELARILGKLSSSKVNVEGISVAASTDVGLVQLVTSDVTKTSNILNKAGVAFTDQDVCVVLMDDEPGTLFKMLSLLAQGRHNLNYIYATGGNCSCKGQSKVVISAPDLKKIEAAWKKSKGAGGKKK